MRVYKKKDITFDNVSKPFYKHLFLITLCLINSDFTSIKKILKLDKTNYKYIDFKALESLAFNLQFDSILKFLEICKHDKPIMKILLKYPETWLREFFLYADNDRIKKLFYTYEQYLNLDKYDNYYPPLIECYLHNNIYTFDKKLLIDLLKHSKQISKWYYRRSIFNNVFMHEFNPELADIMLSVHPNLLSVVAYYESSLIHFLNNGIFSVTDYIFSKGENNYNIMINYYGNKTALFVCIVQYEKNDKYKEYLLKLLKLDVDIDVFDSYGLSNLAYAIIYKLPIDIIKKMIKKSKNPLQTTIYGRTIIEFINNLNDQEYLKLLPLLHKKSKTFVNLPLTLNSDPYPFPITNTTLILLMLMYMIKYKYKNKINYIYEDSKIELLMNEKHLIPNDYVNNVDVNSTKNYNENNSISHHLFMPGMYIDYPFIKNLMINTEDDNFIQYNKNIKNYLSNFDKNISIVQIFISYGDRSGGHSNLLIIDYDLKQIIRFEPHGAYGSYESLLNIDDLIKTFIIPDSIRKFKYWMPQDFLQYCSFQCLDNGEFYETVHVDPPGYCAAWSLWFLEMYINNRRKDVKTLIDDCYSEIANLKIGFRKYIRNYTSLLDSYKVKMFRAMEFPEDLYNNTYYTKDYSDLILEFCNNELKVVK